MEVVYTYTPGIFESGLGLLAIALFIAMVAQHFYGWKSFGINLLFGILIPGLAGYIFKEGEPVGAAMIIAGVGTLYLVHGKLFWPLATPVIGFCSFVGVWLTLTGVAL